MANITDNIITLLFAHLSKRFNRQWNSEEMFWNTGWEKQFKEVLH